MRTLTMNNRISVPTALCLLEAGRLFRARRRIACAVRVRTHTGKTSAIDDQILLTNRLFGEPAFENFTRPCSVRSLCGKRSARRARRQTLICHGPSRVIARRRLSKPPGPGKTRQLTRLQRAYDSVAIDNLPARRVDDVSTALHLADHLLVEEMFRFRVQRTIDGHDIAHTRHGFSGGMPGCAKFALDLFRQTMPVRA